MRLARDARGRSRRGLSRRRRRVRARPSDRRRPPRPRASAALPSVLAGLAVSRRHLARCERLEAATRHREGVDIIETPRGRAIRPKNRGLTTPSSTLPRTSAHRLELVALAAKWARDAGRARRAAARSEGRGGRIRETCHTRVALWSAWRVSRRRVGAHSSTRAIAAAAPVRASAASSRRRRGAARRGARARRRGDEGGRVEGAAAALTACSIAQGRRRPLADALRRGSRARALLEARQIAAREDASSGGGGQPRRAAGAGAERWPGAGGGRAGVDALAKHVDRRRSRRPCARLLRRRRRCWPSVLQVRSAAAARRSPTTCAAPPAVAAAASARGRRRQVGWCARHSRLNRA